MLRKKKSLLFLPAALALFLGLAGFARFEFVERFERPVFDWHMSGVNIQAPDDEIVLITAGEESMARIGKWPWPRVVHARLLGSLGLAKIVMLDVLFPEGSRSLDDKTLAEVVDRLGNVVVAMHFVRDDDGRPQAVMPYTELASKSAALGYTNIRSDIDGLFRFSTPLWNTQTGAVPSFSLAGVALVSKAPPGAAEKQNGGLDLNIDGRNIPVDGNGRLWLNFSRRTYPTWEYADVLEGKIPPEFFRDKIVIIGISAPGAEDMYMVPLPGGIAPVAGARFHAEALRTLLWGSVPERVPAWVDGVLTLLLALAGMAIAGLIRPRLGFAFLATVLGVFVVCVHFVFASRMLWAASILPVAACLFLFLVTLYVRFRIVHRDWEIKSLSVGSIFQMVLHEQPETQDYGQYLKSIWPALQRDMGMQLLEPALSFQEARKKMRLNHHKPPVPGDMLVVKDEKGKPENSMLIQLPQEESDQPPTYTLIGWDGSIPEEQVKSVAVLVMSTSWFYSVIRESERRKTLLFDTIRAMITALDAKDPATAGHSERVADLSRCIAGELGLAGETVESIHLGALIHDVGKIGIPDKILGKEDRLTDAEYVLVKKHPSIGGEILAKVRLPEASRRALVEHHERLDGTGYPAGLKGCEINQASRIVAVADVFDALLSDRPYRKRWTTEEACEYMARMAGDQFDPDVVQALLEVVSRRETDL